MRCFEKGEKQGGISWRCHSAECISFILRWQLRGNVSSRRNMQPANHSTTPNALDLHITALLMWEMPVLLVKLEAKVICFTSSAYANCRRSHVRWQYMKKEEKVQNKKEEKVKSKKKNLKLPEQIAEERFDKCMGLYNVWGQWRKSY